jgi:NitT/TauT family transport system substrate-binding protein
MKVIRSALAALLLAPLCAFAGLTLAIADLPLFTPALIAETEGYFAAEGLDLKVIHCVNGRRCLQHLLAGEADAATVAETPLVFAAHAGGRFEILATMTTSREHRLIGRADRGVRSLADLKGRRLGLVQGTTSQYYADTVLFLSHFDPETVTRVPVPPAEIVDRLVAGDVEAASLYQPYVYEATRRLGARGVVLADSRYYGVMSNLVGRADPPLAEADVLRLLRALQRACLLIQQQPARAKALLARQLKLEPAVIDALWPDADFRVLLEQTLLTTLESQSRWAVREALVPGTASPDFLERLRPGPLRRLDRRAVTLVK